MTDCTNHRPMIGAREGELSPAEAAELAAHVAGCEGCSRWAASLAVTEGLVSEALLAAASRRDFQEFSSQVMARIERRHLGPLARLRRAIVLHPWYAAAGSLVPIAAAVAVAFYVTRSGSDMANSALEVSSDGATTIIQSKDGPLVLIDDDGES